MPSNECPEGMGEPGLPSLAGALLAHNGEQLRSLNLRLNWHAPLTQNGKATRVQAEPNAPLLSLLRGELEHTGTEFGCST